MKKIITTLLCLTLCFASLFAFAACSNDKNSDNLPDFEDCAIGYRLEVYPKVAFDYELADGTIVHIDSITATLTAKNEINEGDKVSGRWYPYNIEIRAMGSTDSSLAGKRVNIATNVHAGITDVISSDGSFDIVVTRNTLLENTIVYFEFAQV